MARALLKSLQCRSNATEDVIISTPRPSSSDNTTIKKSGSTALFCSNSSQSIRDAVILLSQQHSTVSKKHPKPPEQNSQLAPLLKSKSKSKSKSKIRSTQSSPIPVGPSTSFPTLMDLAPGNSSRKVVEIIFESSWSEHGTVFTGQIEMMFRVHNTHRTVSRFEEYRDVVRARADDVRCAVDGNEMMMFHSGSGDIDDGIYDASLASCRVKLPGGGGTIKGVRMFSSSGGAHERTGGGVVGRRSMLVCRVIVGRVKNVSDPRSGGDSVAIGGGKNSELIVFDSRAVLPCFLIIYRL